ncbi:MAG: hypothetical protein IKX99_00265 [Lachnospiraceae bacterium]|nr:hypothetical protein [Lachnospiraceae bacterium]
MKKKNIIIIIVIAAVIILPVIWYFLPKRFGRFIKTEDVASIEVRDGNTGTHFYITDPEDIKYIVENIKSHPMKRGKVSLFYMGTSFHLWYLNSNGKVLTDFIVNGECAIRKDPFFYSCDGGLCFDYLKELSKNNK